MSLQELKQQACQLSVSDRLELIRAIAPSLQQPNQAHLWHYLVACLHPWRRQFYIKGRELLASTVGQDLIANQMSPEQAADNWDLPVAAIYEVIQSCESDRALIKLEAEEEGQEQVLLTRNMSRW